MKFKELIKRIEQMSIIYYQPRGSGKTYDIKKAAKSWEDSNDVAIFVSSWKAGIMSYNLRYNVFSSVGTYKREYQNVSSYFKPKIIYIDEYEIFSDDYKKKLADLYNEEHTKMVIKTSPNRLFDESIIKMSRDYKKGLISEKDINILKESFTEKMSEDWEILQWHFLGNPNFIIEMTTRIE